ncbi:TylF/MycF/NovP-related O-methyltransferase [Aeribacillus sp. FSL K6-8210]|uniref:TylF/MycF/NovP-related O-methyltransferase n=1 Tax=Aeribacillus sp. FSL K6-8210 TaxID=2954683 RepID=UPI0030D36A79
MILDTNEYSIIFKSSSDERKKRLEFVDILKNTPIPDNELLMNLGLYLNRQLFSRILFMHELYKKIINVHGVIMEFGVRWGQNLALFEVFRGIYEPYNYTRKIIGFDTFSGFPSVNKKDGKSVRKGDYSVSENYEEYLKKVLDYHESENPIPHIKKSEIVKGDATKTIFEYLEAHPETVIALAYFDFDLYEPTKVCLEAIRDRLTKGSIIGFDELNHPQFPGETLAVKEVLGLDKYKIQRSPLNPYVSYIVIE